MINKLLYGITDKLYELFKYTVIVNNVEQGFQEPCFYVKQLNTQRIQQLGLRSKRDVNFDIHFFPSEGSEQINSVAQTLLDEMDIITLSDGDLVYGYNLRTEVADDVLHFFVNYNVIVTKETPDIDKMEEIEIGERA